MLDRRAFFIGLGAVLGGCRNASAPGPAIAATSRAARLIAAARAQVGTTIRYDSAYTVLRFPGGDVPRDKGVCTDVVIRAYRDAFALDLQALVNADMRAAFDQYPSTWGLRAPDPSIDHRRVPNLRTWFARHRLALAVPDDGWDWRPGDIFTSTVARTGTHIGIVSDRPGRRAPMIVHNIGLGVREEDALLDWPITGRYRWALA